MPSKYKQKQPKPQTKQTPALKELFMAADRPYPYCCNCGTRSSLRNPQYSKCPCGGTYQLFGFIN